MTADDMSAEFTDEAGTYKVVFGDNPTNRASDAASENDSLNPDCETICRNCSG